MTIKPNIIFTWMPWSWKTTIWKKLSKEIWSNFCDFDDDVLEKITLETAEEALFILGLNNSSLIPEDISHKEVKTLLELLWDDKFLELEWFLWRNLVFDSQTVLSTSWSLPLRLDAMDHLKKEWKIIYIDIPLELIISRLKEMKTDRIIWMWKMTLEEILQYRHNFYNITKDFDFEVPIFNSNSYKTKDERTMEKVIVFNKFMEFYNSNINN